MIRCRGVVKRFYHYEERTTSAREVFIRTVLRRPLHVRRPVFVLEGLDLDVRRGEAVALVGRNGSGKSTALRLIAGIYPPTEGTVETRGRVGSVIELGVGFHPELTGEENVRLYGAVLGLSRREVSERFPGIVEFAGIGPYMDMPVKYYSSGMTQRLGFAVTIHIDADILLLDEALAVGDEEFRHRCIGRIRRVHESGGTLVVVTHDLDAAAGLCSRAIWLDGGRIVEDGPAEAVIQHYRASQRASPPSSPR